MSEHQPTMHHTETAQIIQFSTAARASLSRMSRVEQQPERPARDKGESTVTCRNRRLRNARRGAWRQANALRIYWKARLEMESAISDAQSHGLPEGNNHPLHNPNERWSLLANWRQALAQQMLTPAPDTAAVAWKKAALAGGQHEYAGIKTERVERAITDDVAWLAAHRIRARTDATG